MRLPRLTLSTALTLALLGCASERPTRPGTGILPTVSIHETLLVDTSALVLGSSQPDSTHILDFAGAALFQSGEYDDVVVACVYDLFRAGDGFFILNSLSDEWAELPCAIPSAGIVYCIDRCISSPWRFASEAGIDGSRWMLDSQGRSRVRAARAWNFTGRLLVYARDYQAVKVRSETIVTHCKLDYFNGSLYMTSTYRDPWTDVYRDSLIAFDLSGDRRWAVALVSEMSSAGAFDGRHVWTYDYVNAPLMMLDTLGNNLASVSTGQFYSPSMTWGQGTLWFVGYQNRQPATLYEMDIASSLNSGQLVMTPRFALQHEDVRAITATEDGFITAERSADYRFDASVL